MYSKIVILFSLLSVDAVPNVYDQSQNGELNIQVDLKDLQIFALLKGQHDEYYEDIDYAYDYSEMTIKPQTSTSKKPLNITITSSSTDNATEMTIKQELNTTQMPLNVTSISILTEMATEMMIQSKNSTTQKPLNVTNTVTSTEIAKEMMMKPETSTTQKPSNLTTTGISTDNGIEMKNKLEMSTSKNPLNVTKSKTPIAMELNRHNFTILQDKDNPYDYSLNNIIKKTTGGTSTEYITEPTTVGTHNTSTEERNGFLSFFSQFFVPFSATTISDTPSRQQELQSREDGDRDGVTTSSKNNIVATEHKEAITKNSNVSDPVTHKPQSLMSNILPVQSKIDNTTRIVDTIGSNVTTNSNCRKGFILNQRGGCELKIQTMSNALLKIVKLSQKLKPRRHRNDQDTL